MNFSLVNPKRLALKIQERLIDGWMQIDGDGCFHGLFVAWLVARLVLTGPPFLPPYLLSHHLFAFCSILPSFTADLSSRSTSSLVLSRPLLPPVSALHLCCMPPLFPLSQQICLRGHSRQAIINLFRPYVFLTGLASPPELPVCLSPSHSTAHINHISSQWMSPA